MLEDAEYQAKPIVMLDIDLTHGYDTVEAWVKDAAFAGAVATASATVIRTGRSHLASSLRCSASTAASSTPSSSAATTRTASAPLHALLVAPAACPPAPLSRNFFRVVPRVGDDSVRCFRLPLVALSMVYVCQSRPSTIPTSSWSLRQNRDYTPYHTA